MSNITIRIPKEESERVKLELLRQGFYERKTSDTLWSLSNGNTHALFYPSGTLLLQGKEAIDLKELILSQIEVPNKVFVGCDESGKGDIFGPLVLCCAIIKPDYYRKVLELNLRDCKRMKDEEVIRKAGLFRSFGEFLCRTIEPLELNKMHESIGNLNRILDRLYGNLLEELMERYPYADFLLDAYSAKSPFGDRVAFKTKGEEDLSVAVASVLARAEFLSWLKANGLPKGSSLESMSLARRIYQQGPHEAKKFLKTFFL
ncbi:MAG: ribonuclease HIII [Aquificaceae bacterium]|nr:ribonuclease HIII [Aquificaceae bacterium]MCX8164051.1 ribonuclease HIII [Aquificaceae bacterium]